jgi:hypothetical protein
VRFLRSGRRGGSAGCAFSSRVAGSGSGSAQRLRLLLALSVSVLRLVELLSRVKRESAMLSGCGPETLSICGSYRAQSLRTNGIRIGSP